ncbi:hypothetical protein KC19_12G139400 [Ceratodon purpureus]|uniref:Uncharacterized protein n=1 Tax=Ceratodon purpureus TaxID=3225 RepID=A0A8T0GCS7_CERPU|nr:hypothetical protein KC19_12G139400 [Ceratodon purpureus]KAG0555042.1 hypothetical protein KC19_12G139400 [Ceratodon purpureus]
MLGPATDPTWQGPRIGAPNVHTGSLALAPRFSASNWSCLAQKVGAERDDLQSSRRRRPSTSPPSPRSHQAHRRGRVTHLIPFALVRHTPKLAATLSASFAETTTRGRMIHRRIDQLLTLHARRRFTLDHHAAATNAQLNRGRAVGKTPYRKP